MLVVAWKRGIERVLALVGLAMTHIPSGRPNKLPYMEVYPAFLCVRVYVCMHEFRISVVEEQQT